MPSLANVNLPPYAFEYKDDITVVGGIYSILISHTDIGALVYVVPFPSYTYCMNILEGSDVITDLIVGGRVCPFDNVTVFDLSVYPKLKTLKIGSESFRYVSELRLIGLSELESVVIERNSFTRKYQYVSYITADPNRHFYLKNCPKLRELRIGPWSFSDYTVIEIENVDALEVIEFSDVSDISFNFYYASLELKSILIHCE